MTRSKGSGSLYRDTRGYWTAVIPLPDIDGKRRREAFRSRRKSEAEAWLADRLPKGEEPDWNHLTVSEWLSYWLREVATHKVKPKTYAGYESIIRRHIKPAIGDIGIADLKARDLRQMYRSMIEGGLSSTTANQAHRVLSAAFAIAVREREIDFNPCLTLDAPRKARPHLEALTVAESRTLLAHLRTRSDGALWATYLLTGARRGEVLGLERDRVTTTLELSWQLQTFTVGPSPERLRKPDGFESRHLSGRYFLTRPKSAAGIRVVPLVEPLRSILDDYMRSNQRSVGDLLFAERGHPYDPDSVSRRWRGVLADAGIKKDVRLHGLRHTAVDLMLEAGVPMDVIKEIVGHSSRAMSEAYKSRGNDPRLRDAMTQMAAVIG